MDDIARAADGDTRAFERLYREHAAKIHGMACRMAGHDDAEDLTQEVFVKVWDKLDTFRGDAAFSTWLHRVAVNVILSHRKARGRRRETFTLDEDEIRRAPVGPAKVGAKIDLEGAIGILPDGARQVFVLHDVEGFKHREIADMMDVTEGTSKSQLHRARMLLRDRLTA